jgi:hypothetical protein
MVKDAAVVVAFGVAELREIPETNCESNPEAKTLRAPSGVNFKISRAPNSATNRLLLVSTAMPRGPNNPEASGGQRVFATLADNDVLEGLAVDRLGNV